jgi:phosphoglycerate dehydrogenase-like enzyme
MPVQTRPVLAVLYGGSMPRPPLDELSGSAEIIYATEENLEPAVRAADAVLVWDFGSRALSAAWPADAPPRWVHVASAGVDSMLFRELVDSPAVLTNSRGVFEAPIAEYVLGLVLAMAKDLPTTLAAQHEGRWRHRETERIGGRRALVVGTGPIGRAIARLLRAAGMRVRGAGRRARDDDPDFGTVADDMRPLLPDADYVVAVAPLTDATRGMFDAGAFAAMRPTARFINVGRGGLVVEDDLVAALTGGEVAAAALDVFATEPLPAASPLWTMPNVIISPHMAGDVSGWREELRLLFIDNFRRFASGRPPLNVVDKQLGYVPVDRPADDAGGPAEAAGGTSAGAATAGPDRRS